MKVNGLNQRRMAKENIFILKEKFTSVNGKKINNGERGGKNEKTALYMMANITTVGSMDSVCLYGLIMIHIRGISRRIPFTE